MFLSCPALLSGSHSTRPFSVFVTNGNKQLYEYLIFSSGNFVAHRMKNFCETMTTTRHVSVGFSSRPFRSCSLFTLLSRDDIYIFLYPFAILNFFCRLRQGMKWKRVFWGRLCVVQRCPTVLIYSRREQYMYHKRTSRMYVD